MLSYSTVIPQGQPSDLAQKPVPFAPSVALATHQNQVAPDSGKTWKFANSSSPSAVFEKSKRLSPSSIVFFSSLLQPPPAHPEDSNRPNRGPVVPPEQNPKVPPATTQDPQYKSARGESHGEMEHWQKIELAQVRSKPPPSIITLAQDASGEGLELLSRDQAMLRFNSEARTESAQQVYPGNKIDGQLGQLMIQHPPPTDTLGFPVCLAKQHGKLELLIPSGFSRAVGGRAETTLQEQGTSHGQPPSAARQLLQESSVALQNRGALQIDGLQIRIPTSREARTRRRFRGELTSEVEGPAYKRARGEQSDDPSRLDLPPPSFKLNQRKREPWPQLVMPAPIEPATKTEAEDGARHEEQNFIDGLTIQDILLDKSPAASEEDDLSAKHFKATPDPASLDSHSQSPPEVKRAILRACAVQCEEIRKQLPANAMVEVVWGVPLDQLPSTSKSVLYCVPRTDKYRIYKFKNPKTQRTLKLLKCDYEGCDKTFTKWHNFYDHLRFHTKERPYECPFKLQLGCEFTFTQKSNLNKHIIAHRQRNPNIRPDSEVGIPLLEKQLQSRKEAPSESTQITAQIIRPRPSFLSINFPQIL